MSKTRNEINITEIRFHGNRLFSAKNKKKTKKPNASSNISRQTQTSTLPHKTLKKKKKKKKTKHKSRRTLMYLQNTPSLFRESAFLIFRNKKEKIKRTQKATTITTKKQTKRKLHPPPFSKKQKAKTNKQKKKSLKKPPTKQKTTLNKTKKTRTNVYLALVNCPEYIKLLKLPKRKMGDQIRFSRVTEGTFLCVILRSKMKD